MDSLFTNTTDAAFFLGSLLLSWKIILPTILSIWLTLKIERKKLDHKKRGLFY